MDLINTGTDPWILEYEACEKVAREIMEQLNSRDSDKIQPLEYHAISAKIRIRLKQFSTEVNELKKKLNSAGVVSVITSEEKERRMRQVEVLLSKEIQLTDLFIKGQKEEKSHLPAQSSTRSQLFEKKGQKTVFADMGTTSWGDVGRSNYEEPETRSIEEMKEEQQRLLQEQDKGLESLLKIVSAQTKIAHTINDEVEHHNEILVDISDGMDRVDNRINKATDMVRVIGKKDSIWGYWLVAFLLLVAILGVSLS